MGFKSYCEQYTIGEMTFGMEIEGIVDPSYDKNSLLDEFKDLLSPYKINDENMKDDPSIDVERCGNCDGDGYIDYYDEKEECENCGGTGKLEESFEFVTPPMPCTPKNVSLMIHFFDQAFKHELFHTNSSCGLHVHIGLPDSFNSAEDRFWILCQIAADPELTKFIESMETDDKTFDFVDLQYASNGVLKNIQKSLHNQAIRSLSELFSSDKYRIIRIHPKYNTIEWRGPRNFLNTEKIKFVKHFFLGKLLPLVKVFTKLQIKDTIVFGDSTISRVEFFKLIQSKDPELLYNKSIAKRESKNDHRWDVSQDTNLIGKILAIAPLIKSEQFSESRMSAYISDDNKIIFTRGRFENSVFDSRFGFDGIISLTKCHIENAELLLSGGSVTATQFNECKIISYGHIADSVLHDCSVQHAVIDTSRCDSCSFDEVLFMETTTVNSKSFNKCEKMNGHQSEKVESDADMIKT